MNYVNFNQDHSLLGVATSEGFRLYYTDQFSKCFESKEGDVSMLEMLFSTSLVALVLSPRLLRIQNTKRRSTICELTFPTTVLAVRLNRKRLIIVLEAAIYIYDISNMQMLSTLETSPNPNAICALSPSSENNYIAYPLPERAGPATYNVPSHAPPSGTHISPTTGDVLIYDATKMEQINVVEAHQTPLSCISINSDGTLMATTSEKGTIIRVFSLPDGKKLFQFRRGSIPSRIYSMSFNATSTLLCVSSASETVHIFRLLSQLNGPSSSKSTTGARSISPQTSHNRNSSPSGTEVSDTSTTPSSAPRQPSSPSSIPYFRSNGSSDTPSDVGERKILNPSLANVFRRTSQNVSKTFAATVGGYLPNSVTEMWEPVRDFAWVKVQKNTGNNAPNPFKTVVAMSAHSPQVMVATSEGNYFVFAIDLEKGGEGVLLQEHSLLEKAERLHQSAIDD